MKRLAVGVLWALSCGLAFAAEPPELATIDANLKTCLAQAGGVTPAFDNCNERARASADSILNRIYGDWVAQLKDPSKDEASDSVEIMKRLVTSERAWIAYRDTSCNLESVSMLGGTGEKSVYGHCLYIRTRQRVLDLKAIQGSL